MKAVLLLAAASLAFGQVKLPQYSRNTLPNGAQVFLMPRPGVPLVHFRILLRGGVESDPAGKAGLSSVTAALLRRGTAKRSAAQFAEELDYLGGTFNAVFAGEYAPATAITAEFLSKDFDAGLDLLSDAVLHPAFTDTEARKELARRIDQAKSMRDNPQAAIGSYFRAEFFGAAHPYGSPSDEATYAKIARPDILDYHAKFYCGKNMLIVVTGDFDAPSAKAKIAKAFGEVPAGDAYAWVKAAAPERRAQLLLIDKPDATQTYFQIAQPGIDIRNPDRTALELVNTLFGGRFTSMLNDALRVNSGLTYGAACRLDRNRLTGAISISTYTKTASTGQAIDLALDVLKRFHENGISEAQLASAKAYVKGLYPTTRLETMDQLANLIGEIELFGLGRDEVDGYFARIDGVTLDGANAAIKKYYRTDDLTFVILGAADQMRDQVRKYNPNLREISINTAGWGER